MSTICSVFVARVRFALVVATLVVLREETARVVVADVAYGNPGLDVGARPALSALIGFTVWHCRHPRVSSADRRRVGGKVPVKRAVCPTYLHGLMRRYHIEQETCTMDTNIM